MAAVVRIRELSGPVVTGVQMLAVAACYFAGARLGLLRQYVVDGAVFTPIWPPTGIAVAALLILGLRCWPGIALGAFLAVLSVAPLRPTVVGSVVGNTAAPVCSYLLLRQVGFRNDLSRLRDGAALVFLGALASTLISATVGVGVIVFRGGLPAEDFWTAWPAWWVGDAMGVLIVTPLLLALHGARWPPRMSRWKEALGTVLVACFLVPLATHSPLSMLFLVYPLLIWTALRFQLVGSMLCALFASVLATVAATDQVGPFAGLSSTELMFKLQAFNGGMALTALLLSTVITEQLNTRRSVEQACRELAEVLEHLTAGESRRERLREEGKQEGQSEGEQEGRQEEGDGGGRRGPS
ncbi:MASE1 domain-containing protein [Streptomyces sp. NPDC059378]|uniref:MASE1 domain-containing protein n=1 Tax=Streptomyces sp. NPDC059378 TaxID=3346815 RepID=UPI0036ABD1CB